MDLLLPTDPVVLEARYDELYLKFPLFRKTIDENRISKYEVLHEYEKAVRFITLYVKKPKEKLEGGALQCNIFNVRNFVIILAIALVYFVIYVKPTWDAIDFIEPIRENLKRANQNTVLDAPRNYTKILENVIVRKTYPNLRVETFKLSLEKAFENYIHPQSFYGWFFDITEWGSFFTNVYSTLTRQIIQNPIVASISSAIIALLVYLGICRQVPDGAGGNLPQPSPAAQARNPRRVSVGNIDFEGYTVAELIQLQPIIVAAAAAAAPAAPAPAAPAAPALLGNVAQPLQIADASSAPSPSALRQRRGSVRLGGGVSSSRSSRSRSRSRIVRSKSRTNQKIKNQFKRFIGYVQKHNELKGLEGGALLKRGLRCISASLGLSIMIILVFVIGIYFASIQFVKIDFDTIFKLVENKLIGLLPDFLRDKRANGGSWYAVLREIFAFANANAYIYLPFDKDFTFGVHPSVSIVIGLLIKKVLKAISDAIDFIFGLPTFIWKSSDTLSNKFWDLYNLCSEFLCEEGPKSKELVQNIIESTDKIAKKLNLNEVLSNLPKTKNLPKTTTRQVALPLPRNAPLPSRSIPSVLENASQRPKTSGRLLLKDAEPKK